MMEAVPKQRLDMKHGFMKCIVKNQIDRDNYDKEVRLAKSLEKAKKKAGNHANRKPEMKTYVPPSKQGRDPRNELFILEFEDQDENLHTMMIYRTDDPEEIAKKIGNDCNLTTPYIKALTERLESEIHKRS